MLDSIIGLLAVLGNFISTLNRFIGDRYALNLPLSDYHVHEYFKIWKCSRDEADHRVHEFFKTPYFKKEMNPIPGAREALEKLSKIFNLSVVTYVSRPLIISLQYLTQDHCCLVLYILYFMYRSRQNVIKDHTIEWIGKHYPSIFQEIHFGNHFALDGKSRPKSDICKC
ncbi:uncharacterized protein LOC121799969 isoform X3 [Salvia splendens]|uniref:uncharacterized protein LOC121799969 isoform X3 n=1 Tax=Salvia splendens TaxID=180675 RepID=UPI001C27BF99|nr:uncharacterized protein LOC121799969 isoform X3 [Salvia splendens]